jgi:hypothetical protein
MKKAFLALLKSRKFLILVLDTVISVATYFVAKYAAPEMVGDVKFIIAALQPVALTLIYAIAHEDAATLAAGNVPGRNVRPY